MTASAIITSTEQVEIRKGQTVTVRELYLEDIPVIANELLDLVSSMNDEDLKKDTASTLKALLGSQDLVRSCKSVLAQVTSEDVEVYANLPAISLIKVVRAFLRVNPPEELKQLFFEVKDMLVPEETQKKNLID